MSECLVKEEHYEKSVTELYRALSEIIAIDAPELTVEPGPSPFIDLENWDTEFVDAWAEMEKVVRNRLGSPNFSIVNTIAPQNDKDCVLLETCYPDCANAVVTLYLRYYPDGVRNIESRYRRDLADETHPFVNGEVSDITGQDLIDARNDALRMKGAGMGSDQT